MIEKIRNRIYKQKIVSQLRMKNQQLNIYGQNIKIISPENIQLGENCRINEGVFLHGGGGIKIGNDVTLSAYAKIISLSYEVDDWRNSYLTKEHVGKEIYINDGTWVGSSAIILPGVSILGKGVIIASGSIVNKTILDDFVLVAGNPAKVVKKY